VAVTAANDPLDDDGINPTRALILQAYWSLRRHHPASALGTREILAQIRVLEPDLPLPSPALILTTLELVGVKRRAPGLPSKASCLPPFCPATEPRRRSRLAPSPVFFCRLLSPLSWTGYDPQGDTPLHNHLVALTGRLLCGGWTEGQRHVGAEPLATGRACLR